MKNTKKLFNINIATYLFILTFLLTGLIKNIIIIYTIIIVHELGHICIIKLFKYNIVSIDIYPFGGITTVDKPLNDSINKEILILSFGVIFQVILWLVFIILFNQNIIRASTYNLFKTYNITIMLFNLIPIIPLDGALILRCILEKFIAYKKSFYMSIFISIIFLILFIKVNQVYSLNNYLIVSFLIYKLACEVKNFKFRFIKFKLERALSDFKYKKIIYQDNINLDALRRECFFYFKNNGTYISEKSLLKQFFLYNKL